MLDRLLDTLVMALDPMSSESQTTERPSEPEAGYPPAAHDVAARFVRSVVRCLVTLQVQLSPSMCNLKRDVSKYVL